MPGPRGSPHIDSAATRPSSSIVCMSSPSSSEFAQQLAERADQLACENADPRRPGRLDRAERVEQEVGLQVCAQPRELRGGAQAGGLERARVRLAHRVRDHDRDRPQPEPDHAVERAELGRDRHARCGAAEHGHAGPALDRPRGEAARQVPQPSASALDSANDHATDRRRARSRSNTSVSSSSSIAMLRISNATGHLGDPALPRQAVRRLEGAGDERGGRRSPRCGVRVRWPRPTCPRPLPTRPTHARAARRPPRTSRRGRGTSRRYTVAELVVARHRCGARRRSGSRSRP